MMSSDAKFYDKQTGYAWRCFGYSGNSIKRINECAEEFKHDLPEEPEEILFEEIRVSRRYKNMTFLHAKSDSCPEGYYEVENAWQLISD